MLSGVRVVIRSLCIVSDVLGCPTGRVAIGIVPLLLTLLPFLVVGLGARGEGGC